MARIGSYIRETAETSVQATWDLGPVAFDDQGFIGLR